MERSIREIISNILRVQIPPKGYNKIFVELDAQGKMDNKTHLAMILALIKQVEVLEEEIKKLNVQQNPRQ